MSIKNELRKAIVDTYTRFPEKSYSIILARSLVKTGSNIAHQKIKEKGPMTGFVCGTYTRSLSNILERQMASIYDAIQGNKLISYCVNFNDEDEEMEEMLQSLTSKIPKVHINWNYDMIKMWRED